MDMDNIPPCADGSASHYQLRRAKSPGRIACRAVDRRGSSPGDSSARFAEWRAAGQIILVPTGKHNRGQTVSTYNTYLAIFLGSNTGPRRAAWDALPEGDRRAKEREGIAAWTAWVEKHRADIVAMGGPLGSTKQVSHRGIDDTRNDLAAFTIVRADSHEDAARLFEKHPHFSIFPGDSVEIMPVLPIPAGA
jgi:hypothetical protein